MNKLKTAIRNAEVDGLSDLIIRIFKADEKVQSDSFLKSSIEELETLSAEITTAILQDKPLSTLNSSNKARNSALKTLEKVLEGYAVFPIEAKKALSIPLKSIYDKYGKAGILTASFADKSSMIESMLEDFYDDSLSENIKELEGVAEAVSSIRSSQDDFNRANDEYIKAKSDNWTSASSLNKKIVSLINDKLITYLNAMIVAGNESCADFAQNIEYEINHVNNAISKRGKKNTAKTKDHVTDFMP